jgi:transcriptional regulator with XRE-family HTH domain
VDIASVIKRRLKELGVGQKRLAAAAQVTESYISQLLSGKKTPPAPDRSDIYDKMGRFLKLPSGELSKLADLQRREALRKKLADPPRPLFQGLRELMLRKCAPDQQEQVRAILEKEPFGELERLVTQKLLDVAKRVAREELESENWVRLVARLSGRTYARMRVTILEFLETDVFHVSVENWVFFLDPLIESWDVDLRTLAVEIVLNRRLALAPIKRFEFVEREPEPPFEVEPGLEEFLKNTSLSGDASAEEIEFLKRLKFGNRRPVPLYYYRALQDLRDPLHFQTPQ